MASSRSIGRVLFRVAGGRRLGFGHIARALSLARAMRTPARLSVRGTAETQAIARRMGARPAAPVLAQALRAHAPSLVVIDDPNPRAARQALAQARRQGLRVASIHDLGIAGIASDLAIDGSLARRGRLPARAALRGARYAILDPRLAPLTRRTRRMRAAKTTKTTRTTQTVQTARTAQTAPTLQPMQTVRTMERPAASPAATPTPTAAAGRGRATARSGARPRVLISLGGGPRRALGRRIAEAILAAHPEAHVTLAGGFAGTRPIGPRTTAAQGVRALSSPAAFRPALARTDVAVLAGGVSLYEAAALGVPAVAMAVVPAQRPTVRAFAAADAALDAGAAHAGSPRGTTRTTRAVVRLVSRLLHDAALRAGVSRRARGLIDGRGAARAAAALQKLVIAS